MFRVLAWLPSLASSLGGLLNPKEKGPHLGAGHSCPAVALDSRAEVLPSLSTPGAWPVAEKAFGEAGRSGRLALGDQFL